MCTTFWQEIIIQADLSFSETQLNSKINFVTCGPTVKIDYPRIVRNQIVLNILNHCGPISIMETSISEFNDENTLKYEMAEFLSKL